MVVVTTAAGVAHVCPMRFDVVFDVLQFGPLQSDTVNMHTALSVSC